MKYNFLSLFLLMSFFCIGQESVEDYKRQLQSTLDLSSKEKVLLVILEHYTQPGQLNRDSIRKYNEPLLEMLSGEALSENQVKSKAYRLLSDYRMPYEQYVKQAKENIRDYYTLENYEGVLKEHYYLCSKASRSGIGESISMFEEGLQMCKDFEDFVDVEIICRYRSKLMSSLAANYERIRLFEQAIDFSLKSVENAEVCGDSLSLLFAYRSTGAIIGNAQNQIIKSENSSLNLSVELKRLLNKALLYSKNLNQDVIYTLASYNLAFYHYDHGSIDLALEYLNESESIEDLQWVPRQKYFNQILFSDIYQDQGQTEKSFKALEKANSASQEMNDPYFNNKIHLDFSRWYFIEKMYSKSMRSLKNIDISSADNLEIELGYYKSIYKIEKAQKNFDGALQANEQYHILQDSLSKISSEKSISKLIGQYKISKANEEIAILKADQLTSKLGFERTTGIGLLGLFFIVGLFGVKSIEYNQNLLKSKEKHQRVQQQLFRAQMNPHFIFNTLGSIQSFLLQPGQTKEAAYFLTKFAKLMRQILSQSQQDLIPLEEEIKTIENYLLLQRMRFEEKFEFTITVDPKLRENIVIPPMIIQPIIENAIEHGKIYNRDNGLIAISIQKLEKAQIEVVVQDNGLGIASSSTNKHANKSSISTSIIKQRLASLYKDKKHSSSLAFVSPEEGGTLVKLTLPLIEM